jgi:hypothetical protein
MTTTPIIEPISNAPAVKTRRSQPGSVADTLPEPVLFEAGLEGEPEEEEVVVPVA